MWVLAVLAYLCGSGRASAVAVCHLLAGKDFAAATHLLIHGLAFMALLQPHVMGAAVQQRELHAATSLLEPMDGQE